MLLRGLLEFTTRRVLVVGVAVLVKSITEGEEKDLGPGFRFGVTIVDVLEIVVVISAG